MMTQTTESPKLRFRADDGSEFPKWKSMPMRSLFSEVIEKKHPEYPVLSIRQGCGTILRDSSDRNIEYDKSNLTNYKVIEKGDFIIHLRSFEGGLECSALQGISSPAYRILRSDCIIPEAYKDYFRSHEFINHRLSEAVVGIRDGKNIDMNIFWEIKVPYMALPEQQKIADFLSAYDKKIFLQKERVETLKEQKKGLLQKMFPKKGETVPELRFPGFTGDWEQRKLGDIGSVAMCRRIFKHQTSESGEIPFFKIGTFGGEPDAFITCELFEEFKAKYPYPDKGDILISASGSIGRTVEFTGENEYFQDSNIVWLKHDKSIINPFLRHLYSVVEWAGIEGSTIKRLYNDNILKTEVMLPSVQEQTKIAEMLDGIDSLITLHQRKLETMQEIKKGLLQQMFV